MNAPFDPGTKPRAMIPADLVLFAKRNPPLARYAICIALEKFDAAGDSDGVAAAQYCLDNLPHAGCFDELDELFAAADRFERVLDAAGYYPGGELPDWRLDQMMGEAA